MKLRDYQQELFDTVHNAASNDLIQLDTGGGKTPIIAALAQQQQYWLVVAHRNTLIQQASATIARFGLDHDTISSAYTRRRCMAAHREQGHEHIVPGCSSALVASVDGIMARYKRGQLHIDRYQPWLVLIDEAHHAICDNKWGALAEVLPNARFVGFTATPARTDGRSLHADNHGLFDRLVQASALRQDSVRTLIENGHIADFDAWAPALTYGDGTIDSHNEYGPRLHRGAQSWAINGHILFGDILDIYQRLIGDRRTVVMLPRIDVAETFTYALRDAGYSAAAVHCKMPQTETYRRIDAFAHGEFQFLCNVDIINEGFDLPGIEAISLLRKTQSTVLYRQWVGRTLRSAPGKRARIIDHVGNIMTHGMPDRHIDWSQRFIRPPADDRLIACQACEYVFNVYRAACPCCGWLIEPEERSDKPGTYAVKNIDWELVKQERSAILQRRAEQSEAERLAREIDLPSPTRLQAQGSIGQACIRIRDWVANQASNDVPIATINDWLRSEQAEDPQWYMQRFTLADTRTQAPKKAAHAINDWQRQTQAHA
ncbi:DEAD/DEAH box helicase family protein [Salinisphaera sp. USBA-960]|nr:DEAD/DEAH box helicase family protein [Salifodinibacter halophilus]NNC25287.1 DEAD/DEAH box helicase family protein [Salifodinibacter halophilus]